MANFSINDVIRSLKVAVFLQLNGLSPVTDFSQIGSFPKDSNGRLLFSYEGQDMPGYHGPTGTMGWPSISCEHDAVRSSVFTRYDMPVVISLVREINVSTEREEDILERMGRIIEPLIYEAQTCPIYSFVNDTDYADEIIGALNWYFEIYGYGYPEVEVIGGTSSPQGTRIGTIHDDFQKDWMRKEYRFTTTFVKN